MSILNFSKYPNFSEKKRAIYTSVYEHLYPGRVDRFLAGGIDFVPAARSGYRYWDIDGKEFLDLHINGGTFNLGHRHPELVATLREASESWDIGNHHFPSEPKAKLAEALINSTPGDMKYVVFTSSGSEANDVAIKSARYVTGRRKVVAISDAYHGRTGLSGAAGDDSTAAYFHSDYPREFIKVPFNNLAAMEAALRGRDVALVMMETIPATSGFPIPAQGYHVGVKRLCEKYGTIFLADEVQTGLGRTGARWAIEVYGVEPDMLVTGKGLSGGMYPMSALVMTAKVGAWLETEGWGHVSTFGGSDLGCVVALKALEISLAPSTLANVKEQANFLLLGLEALRPRFPFFTEIRQQGLVMGLKFADSLHGKGMMRALYESGIWAISAGFDESVIQFKPGLLVDRAFCEEVLKRFENACIWLTNNLFALITGGNPPDNDPVLISLRALAEEAIKQWNIKVESFKLIKHRENTVYKVNASNGCSYALRVHRYGYHTDDELRSEITWMRALQAGSGIDTPNVVRTRASEDFINFTHPSVENPRQVSVLEWIEGTSFDHLGRVERGVKAELEDRYFRLGIKAAEMHRHSASWEAPSGFVRSAWDEDGLLGERPLMGRFWDHPKLTPAQRKQFQKARIVLRELLKKIGKSPESYGMIHADFLPENILVDGSKMQLIDFDDCGPGWYLFEVAASLFPHVNQPFFDELLASYLQGYRTVRAISAEHESYIPAFIMMRAFSYLGWLMSRGDTIPNADRIADQLCSALAEFIPQLLAELTPIQRIGVSVMAVIEKKRR